MISAFLQMPGKIRHYQGGTSANQDSMSLPFYTAADTSSNHHSSHKTATRSNDIRSSQTFKNKHLGRTDIIQTRYHRLVPLGRRCPL